MAAYLPGPWDARYQNEGWDIYDDDTQCFAGVSCHPKKANEPTARLIASSPDLLEAALAMLNAFGDEVWDEEKAEALDKLMDAINKAAGES